MSRGGMMSNSASAKKSLMTRDKSKIAVVAEEPIALEAEHSMNVSKPPRNKDPDDIENNTDKAIDFQAQLEALKRRTETELPHTLTQVEDIMYLDQYSVISLEYHYYQNDCKYLNMNPCNEHLDETG